MDLGIQNKRFLVTGSTRGIGRAIAETLTENLGRVAISSRNPEDVKSISAQLKGSIGFGCDFKIAKNVVILREEMHAKWGAGLDGLILNVGSGKSIADPLPNPEHFFETMQTNFNAAVHAVDTFMDDVIKNQGSIVFISSIAGIDAIGAPTDYSVAKAALISLSKNLARKLGQSNVRVNTIAPGNILFPSGSWAAKIEANAAQVSTYISKNVPLKRFGTPQEIAAACAFLCSKHATFISGSTLVIDGGQMVGSHGN
jgi:3-oxoacyl-[acyl-carrier protein] reductase